MKKIIALLLAAVMVIGMFTITASAGEAPEGYTLTKEFEGEYGFGDAFIVGYTNDDQSIFYFEWEAFDEDQALAGTIEDGIATVTYDMTGFMTKDAQLIWDNAVASEEPWEPITGEAPAVPAAPAEEAEEAAPAAKEGFVAPEGIVYPAETVLIGVELYDPTESETIAMQNYFSYLEENMNIKFKYSEAIGDASDEIQFIEDCAISGCQGFLGRYNVTGIEQLNQVIGYGMYFVGQAEDDAIYAEYKNNDHYVGGVHTGNDDYNRGLALAQWVLDQGYNKVIYASGGADFGVEMFVNRQQGFLDGLEGNDVEVITVSGFPGDQFFADQAAALSQDGVQAVVASFNGVPFWAQPIETAGLKDTVKLATIGSMDESTVAAFESGALSFLSADNYQRYGLLVGLICNAVDGNKAALEENGEAINETYSTWTVTSAEEAEKYLDILNNEKVFDANDIMSLCVAVNPDASRETLRDLINGSTSEALMAE